MRILPLPNLIGFILIFIGFSASAQEFQVSKYTSTQIEALFLDQNLELIAERMNVDLVDAEIAQTKLWDNPQLSIGSINLWSTGKQRDELGAEAFPRNTQFSIELSQLVQTANKKGKLVSSQRVSKEIAIQNFEEVLRGLKIELRKLVHEIEYLQSYREVLFIQQKSLERLISVYKKQTEQGNIAKSELLRLQSGLLELENDINETQKTFNEQQKRLKSLLNASPTYIIQIEKSNTNNVNPDCLSLASLIEKASELRPDIKRVQLQTLFHEKSLAYEKAQRIPDITLSVAYDRYGGVWRDFVGFGISFDLPFLNRNQGNIKAAKIGIEQSRLLDLQQQNVVHHEIAEAFSNYMRTYKFYKEIEKNELLGELDIMLGLYSQNLLSRNISMLEFLDFMEAYRSNKETVLSAYKEMYLSFEELQYAIGTEIK